MTFDKQSNGRRTTVESKSNRSCNHRINKPSAAVSASAAYQPAGRFFAIVRFGHIWL